MTQTFAQWLGWLFSNTVRPAPRQRVQGDKPMKIEVERLPDYLWRELGFAPKRRAEDDPWRQVQ